MHLIYGVLVLKMRLYFAVDLWRETVIELECKQHNFRGKKDEK